MLGLPLLVAENRYHPFLDDVESVDRIALAEDQLVGRMVLDDGERRQPRELLVVEILEEGDFAEEILQAKSLRILDLTSPISPIQNPKSKIQNLLIRPVP